MIDLYQGDCLDEMDKVADHTVDMIFTDLPYGTTKNVWDVPIPLDQLWEQYKRVLKPGGVALLFAQMPFGADLINSNRKWFRYEWIWYKTMAVGFLNAKEYMIRTYTDEGETVLDSCMGGRLLRRRLPTPWAQLYWH